jgi:hypothetical protein
MHIAALQMVNQSVAGTVLTEIKALLKNPHKSLF